MSIPILSCRTGWLHKGNYARTPPSSSPLLAFAGTAAFADPVTIPVAAAPSLQGPLSGRLIVFARRVEPGAAPETEIDVSPFEPTGTAVAAREIDGAGAGQVAAVDGEIDTFPAPFSALPPGTYRFQAVLDRNHDYNYGGRGEGDIVSPVVEARLPGPAPRLTLSRDAPARPIRRRRSPACRRPSARRRARPRTMRSRSISSARSSPPSGGGRSTCAAGSRCRRAIGRTGRPFR